MARSETITVSMREIDRLKTVQAVVDGFLAPGIAADRLNITDRQLRRIVQRYRSEGAQGLLSKRRGRAGNHQLSPGLEQTALAIIRDRYNDFGPTLAGEKLKELHGIQLSKETVRRIMIDAYLWVPRQQRPPKIYQPRHRRACFGELIQIDGSEHDWFEGRAPMCTLIVYVDDATSRLVALYFAESESTFSYFAATRAYLDRYGKPIAFYSDKASVFRVNNKDAQGGDGHTQFGRALYELNIEGICANSSQAKGRVERAHQTLQDRLVKELRLRGISTIEDANTFAQTFMDDYNQRFAKPPKNDHDAHRPIRPDERLDLIFSFREPRRVSQSLTLQYDKALYLLEDNARTRKLIGKYVNVHHYPNGVIELRCDEGPLPHTTYDRLSEVDQGAIVDNKRLGHVLRMAHRVQEQRDNRRSLSGPAERGVSRSRSPLPGKKSQRSLNRHDIEQAISDMAD